MCFCKETKEWRWSIQRFKNAYEVEQTWDLVLIWEDEEELSCLTIRASETRETGRVDRLKRPVKRHGISLDSYLGWTALISGACPAILTEISRFGDRLSWPSSCLFSVPPGTCHITVKLSQERFVSHLSNSLFFNHIAYQSKLYNLSY
jgi:hypothetical protein